MFKSAPVSESQRKLKVYGFPLSQPVRSVLHLCHEANIEFDFILVDALKGETRQPSYVEAYPAALVPMIQEEGLGTLGESAAIMQYLADSRGLTKWYPEDPVQRARVNYWLSWHHRNTRKATLNVLVPMLFPPEGPNDALEQGKKEVAKVLGLLELHLRESGTRFLVGNEHPTLADLLLLPELDQLGPRAFAAFDFSPYPLVLQWMADTTAAMTKYDEVFGPVVELGEKHRSK